MDGGEETVKRSLYLRFAAILISKYAFVG